MSLPLTSLTTALLMMGYMALTVRIMLLRRQHNISLMDGDNPHFQRLLRAQGNFAEYMPFALLALLLLELQGAAFLPLSLLAATLVVGRASHAYGLLIGEPNYKDFRGRVFGMVCTWTPLGIMAVWLCLISLV